MQTGYLGLDIGSISTKSVIIDYDSNIIHSSYIWTEGDPIGAVQKIISSVPDNMTITTIGTTGSARKLAGAMLNADIVKNEITAHAVGALSLYPDVKTIFEIGGQDSKIILIDNGIITDYAMNTLCAAGTGAFLSSQAARLGIPVDEFGEYAVKSKNPSKIAARCTVFAESDLVHKAQIGHKKEDIIAGLCRAVADNYLNNVAKGKKIKPPVIFQGGVSKNIGVLKAFEDITGEHVTVNEHSHLTGALGAAILSGKYNANIPKSLSLKDLDCRTAGGDCTGCANNCELVYFYRNDILVDVWGKRCEN